MLLLDCRESIRSALVWYPWNHVLADRHQCHTVNYLKMPRISPGNWVPRQKSRTAPPASFGGIRRGVRRPLCGHLNTASGGKRGGAARQKHRLGKPVPPLNRVLELARRSSLLLG